MTESADPGALRRLVEQQMKRLGVIVTRIDHWESCEPRSSTYAALTEELLLDAKQCLRSVADQVSAALGEAVAPSPDTQGLRRLVEQWREKADHSSNPGLFRLFAQQLEAALTASPAPGMVHECSECQHVFSAKELAAEDPDAWGHPCWGMKRKGVCEANRVPSVLSAAKATVRPARPPECVHEWETRVSVMGDSIRCRKCGVFSPGIRVTSPAPDEEPRS